jgi:hypothetical protein
MTCDEGFVVDNIKLFLTDRQPFQWRPEEP